VVFKPAGLFALAATAAVNMDGAVPVIHLSLTRKHVLPWKFRFVAFHNEY